MSKINNPTDEQLAQLVEQHGEVKVIEVGEATFAFKKCDRTTYKAAQSAMLGNGKKTDPSAFAETILINCCLWNKELLEEMDYFVPLSNSVDQIVSSYFDHVGKFKTLQR